MEALYIVGAGGIGCAVGHALSSAGVRVTFVDADREKVLWGHANGVRIDGLPDRPAAFVHFRDWSPEPDARVLLCTKCYDNTAVLERLPASATPLPIQNGFDPELMSRGHDLEGIASFVSECELHRAHTRITRRGRLHLGPRGIRRPGASAHDFLMRLANLLRKYASFRVEVVPDILPYKYTKLMYNAAISPLAAAAGLDNGQLLSVRTARALFFELLRENYSILHAARISMGKIGPFHPATVSRILHHRVVAHALAWALYPTLRGSYCSMSSDLPRGRTEIDYYNGHLLDLAEGRPAPLNRRIFALVKRMEQERTPPGVAVLEELLATPRSPALV